MSTDSPGSIQHRNAVLKSSKLDGVCYDIRGPVLERAKKMEEDGHRIIKLNIGNPAAFGFEPPETLSNQVIHNLPNAAAYCDSKGLLSAREAVLQDCQRKAIRDAALDCIWVGNGVSELIVMTMQALLNNGDEVLIPTPDYPLWTAAVRLSGGVPRHYRCDESAGWLPDLENLRQMVGPKTRAIVVINPNNPTGAVYPLETLEGILEIARRHQLTVFADEIYDRVVYDGNRHVPAASLADDVLFVTFNGLSKNHRACGYRAGWIVVSGSRHDARDYVEGLDILASMRLCANVPAQYAIETALAGPQSVDDLVAPTGRFCRQRDFAWQRLSELPGVSCVKPQGALYLFPRFDPEVYPITNDEQFILDLLVEEKVLVVQGSGFGWPHPDHVRIVFLPSIDELQETMERMARYLRNFKEKSRA